MFYCDIKLTHVTFCWCFDRLFGSWIANEFLKMLITFLLLASSAPPWCGSACGFCRETQDFTALLLWSGHFVCVTGTLNVYTCRMLSVLQLSFWGQSILFVLLVLNVYRMLHVSVQQHSYWGLAILFVLLMFNVYKMLSVLPVELL